MDKPRLRWRVKCACGREAVGDADTYPEAWGYMDDWKHIHSDAAHLNRHKEIHHYSWVEDVRVIGDRTAFDGIHHIHSERAAP